MARFVLSKHNRYTSNARSKVQQCYYLYIGSTTNHLAYMFSVTAAKQSIEHWLLCALWANTFVHLFNTVRLLEWNAQSFGTHSWSTLLRNCISVKCTIYHRLWSILRIISLKAIINMPPCMVWSLLSIRPCKTRLISKPLQAPWFLWQYCTHHIRHI